MKLSQVFNHKKNEEEQQIDIIKNSEFFDTKWYLEQNPDVKARRMSAARHYLRTGWKENRNPSPKFNNDKYLREHQECRICPLIFEYNRNSFVDLAICAIMKNEGPYVKEWIDYHRLVGVKRFYIYDNESTDNMYQELLPYISQGIVVYKYYLGEARQVPAYNECLKEYQDKMQWLAFIDADEFIVPKEKKTIPEFLKDYEKYSGVGINWICFDSNGHKEKPDGGVLENYTRVHYDDNWWQNHYIKSIVKVADLVRADVHNNAYKNEKYAVETNQNQIDSKGLLPSVSVDKIQVNHYYCKSEEEADIKGKRGVSIGKELKPIKPFELYFREYKYDCSIYRYLYQLKPEIAKREKIKYFWFQVLNKIQTIKYFFIKDEISKFVDSKWYFSQYPEAKKSKLTAKEHYMQIGWKLGYNPSSLFDTKFYLEKHKDVAKTDVCPLLHYISNGQYEGRQSLPNVSPVPVVFKENKNSKGFNIIRKSFLFLISPFIKTRNYIKNDNKSLSNTKDKDIAQSEFFDEKWYFAKYWDARCSTLSALEHYRTIGWKKGYNPSEKFNTLKYLKQYPECKICPLDFEYNRNGFVDLSIVAIMKNEGPYVKEWIDYHRLVGVKRFYIYDNESTDDTKQILLPYISQGIVVYKYYPGDAKQMPAYNDCIKRYKDKTQWLAIIDADEFILPVEKNTISEFLKDYEEYPGVGIDWVVYDSNGHKRKPKGGVLENYTRVHYDETIVPAHLIKTIVQPQKVDKIINPHFALFINDELAVNENKEEIGGVLKERAYISPFSINKIRINHYYCKSKEESEYKTLRGTSDGTRPKIISSDILNFKEYKYDYSANKFVVQLKPEIAKREKLKYVWLQLLNRAIAVKYWFKRDYFKNYINEKWYFAQYPDAKESGLSAREHYTQKGWRLGYNPSPLFDTNFYLEKYKDVANIHICPLLHYIFKGKTENRQPLPNYKPQPIIKNEESMFKGFKIWCKVQKKFADHAYQKFSSGIKNIFYKRKPQENPLWNNKEYFDEQWYLKQYPEVKDSGLTPREHYDTIGWKKGYNPSENFDTKFYLEHYPDIEEAHINPLIHYLRDGIKENRLPKMPKLSWKKVILTNKKIRRKSENYINIYKSNMFDKKWYLEQYQEVKKENIDPITHYLNKGWKLGYNPSKKFSTKMYLNEYPDIKQAKMNPLVHYINAGKKEGRKCFPVKMCCHKNINKTNKSPLISIIVASYNYEQYIGETIDSLVAQTYKNFEVIVVDDGSKDNSVNVIKKYVKKYPNVFLYRHPQGKNKGLPATVKLGIEKSKGEYIAFCESDDIWNAEHLQKKVDIINWYKNVNLISNNIELFGDTDSVKERQKYIDEIDEFLEEGGNNINLNFAGKMNYIPTFSALMVKTDIIKGLNFKSPIPAWLDFWLYRQILNKNPLYYTHEKLTRWRMHKSFNDVAKAQKNTENSDYFILKSNQLIGLKGYKCVGYDIIKSSKYWDTKYYTTNYKRKLEGIDPINHYLSVGWRRGYNPSQNFDNNAYIGAYIDIFKSSMQPLLHYEQYGKKENREIFPVMKAKDELTVERLEKMKQQKQIKKIILLLSHELSLTGAPRAILNMAISLKKQGYYPIVISWKKGDLIKEIKEQNIDVILDVKLYLKFKKQNSLWLELLSIADVVLFNTLVSLHLWDVFPNTSARKIAWLHEGQMSYDTLGQIMDFKKIFNELDTIYSVGKYSQSFADQYITDMNKSKTLLYGIEDIAQKIEQHSTHIDKEKVKMILAGAVSVRKGHDILMQAYDLLTDNIKKQIEIYIAGPVVDKELEEELTEKVKNEESIKYLGSVPHDKLMQLYQDMDIILCPSRDDPMPIVCTEAFMLEKPVIISENTGTSALVKDKDNGFIISVKNVQILADSITYAVNNRDKLPLIGKKSRQIYEDYFTIEKFDENVKKIMEENIFMSNTKRTN